jgi:peroxiredoxin
MKKYILTLFAISLISASFSQTPQEAMAALIRKKLGEDCIIKDTSGKQITFENAADQVRSSSAQGKRVKYDPFKVVEGKMLEVTIRFVDPSSIKPTIDEIDFSNISLGFYDELKKKIQADEFKKIVSANPNLVAAAFNANDGIVKDYYIIPKPKPGAVQVVTNGNGTVTSVTSVADASVSTTSTATIVEKTDSGLSIFEIGNKIPEFKMTDIKGKKWSSKDLKDKIAVLNFWFVECPPCIAEMPSLNKLVEKYKSNDNVVFLSIADSDKAKIEKFLSKRDFNYTHVAREQARKYLFDWDMKMYPQNVVINKGKVSFSFSGGSNSNDDFMFNMLSEEIEKSLKG